MKKIRITRILSGNCRGSSRPVIVETSSGRHLVKLRGAAQGAGALVSEIIVAELAEALQLPTLKRRLAFLESNTPTNDKNDELADLLNSSTGLNLAFPEMSDAHDATSKDVLRLTTGEKAAILWLDRFVMNPDRTGRNPNILCCKEGLYLIDHGAALRFQYNWSNVSEETPRYVGSMYKPHIFEMMSESSDWIYWEAQFAEYITRSILEKATAEVPNSFICPLLPNSILDKSPETQKDAIQRRKAAYVAFLWKRLKSPRAFALEQPIYQKINSSKNTRLMDR